VSPQPVTKDLSQNAPRNAASTYSAYITLAISAIFATGVAFAISQNTVKDVERLRVQLDAYIVADQLRWANDPTPVLQERVKSNQFRIEKTEQVLDDLRAVIDRMDKNLVAVCAATPRAQCVR